MFRVSPATAVTPTDCFLCLTQFVSKYKRGKEKLGASRGPCRAFIFRRSTLRRVFDTRKSPSEDLPR